MQMSSRCLLVVHKRLHCIAGKCDSVSVDGVGVVLQMYGETGSAYNRLEIGANERAICLEQVIDSGILNDF